MDTVGECLMGISKLETRITYSMTLEGSISGKPSDIEGANRYARVDQSSVMD